MLNATLICAFANPQQAVNDGESFILSQVATFWQEIQHEPYKSKVPGKVSVNTRYLNLSLDGLVVQVEVSKPDDADKLAAVFRQWWNKLAAPSKELKMIGCVATLK